MPTISVHTTSQSFGLLPADLTQYSNWLTEYGNPAVTIYQDEYNVASTMLNIGNAGQLYLETYGYSFLGLVNSNEWELDSGPYKVDYFGSFSSTISQVSKVTLYDSASGVSSTQTGTFDYSGYPFESAAAPGSLTHGCSTLDICEA